MRFIEACYLRETWQFFVAPDICLLQFLEKNIKMFTLWPVQDPLPDPAPLLLPSPSPLLHLQGQLQQKSSSSQIGEDVLAQQGNLDLSLVRRHRE